MSTMMEYDTGPLNWVRGEIDKSLKAAQERIQAFKSDPSITNALRLACDEAHQASGALRVVGLEGAATLCTLIEEVTSGIEQGEIPQDKGLDAASRALEGLSRWVGRMAEGRGEGELALFPYYRALRELQGAERVFEGELFFPDLQTRVASNAPTIDPSPEEFKALVKSSRAAFQRGLLSLLKGVNTEAGLTQMRDALTRIEAAAPSNSSRTFWWACSGFIDALLANGVEVDFHVKQLLARIDLQMRRLLEGSPQVAERLMRDALFFVAKSKSMGGRAQEIKSSFRLDRYMPKSDVDPETLSRLRPMLEEVKVQLSTTRNAWHDHTEGKAGAMEHFKESLNAMSEKTGGLQVSSMTNLIDRISQSVSEADGAMQPETLNLEIATTLLFIQQALESEDVLSKEFAQRAEYQGERLLAAAQGKPMPDHGAPLMDEGSLQAREHSIMAQLGQEVGVNLKRMEEILDGFFRNPENRDELPQIDQLAQQVNGALSILDQQQARQLLDAAMNRLQPHIAGGSAPAEAEQHVIADALSSLGLFIEAHCTGRTDAQKILVPVMVSMGLIEPVETEEEAEEPTVESGLPNRKSAVANAYLDWQLEPAEDTKKKLTDVLAELGHDADLIDDAGLKAKTDEVLTCLAGSDYSNLATLLSALTGQSLPAANTPDTSEFEFELTLDEPTASDTGTAEEPASCAVDFSSAEESVEQLADTTPLPEIHFEEPAVEASAEQEAGSVQTDEIVLETASSDIADVAEPTESAVEEASPAPQAVQAPSMPEVDPELLDIFLEEAAEVLDNMAAAEDACRADSHDKENLTVIRRGFHTLKGSGRMVGLTDLGEAAWGMEQMMNGWLGADKAANAQLLSVIETAREQFRIWISALREPGTAFPDMADILGKAARLARGEDLQDQTEVPPVEATVTTEESVQTAQEASDTDAAVSDDILVGSISLSSGLYQVFLQEAGQRTQVLQEEMASHDGHAAHVVSEAALRSIHTLAGIAGTSGFNVMADLAHVLELYWGRLTDRQLPTEALPLVHATVERLNVMLSDIGNLVEPSNAIDLIEAIAQLPTSESNLPASISMLNEEATRDASLPVPASEIAQPPATDLQVEIISAEASPEEAGQAQTDPEFCTVEFPEITEPTPDIDAQETQEAVAESEADSSLEMNAPPAAFADEAPVADEEVVDAASASVEDDSIKSPSVQGMPNTPSPVFEQRVIHDEIDADLLPIFLEEADVLVPETAASLRAWKENPADNAPMSALRRSLHTIKGSARMAGANRLGELTHHMETLVIDVIEGRSVATREVFESLESMFDRLADATEKLHEGPQAIESITVETQVTQSEVVLPEDVSAEASAPSAENAVPQAAPAAAPAPSRESLMLRVRADWVDRMVNQAGEVTIARSRIESEMFALKRHVVELAEALNRLRTHIREVEIQAESQMQATFQTTGKTEEFDPLEFDRFTRFQEVTRFVAESVNDISTVQHTLLGRLGETEAALTQQARISRELQQDLLRVRMVPLYSISERLHRVVRQTARDLGKRAQIDIRNAELELDRSVLEKVTAPIEHLLRNAIAHGIEMPEQRHATGKPELGEIRFSASQEGNEMVLVMQDDGAGLNMEKIRARAVEKGLLSPGVEPTDAQLAQFIFQAGFSTAEQLTAVAGRGVGMDVVKSEITALGGRIDIDSKLGRGVTFTIYLPLTLAVTQAVIISAGKEQYALPATMVGQVQELKPDQLAAALSAGAVEWRGVRYPLYYMPHLLGQTSATHEVQRYNPVVLMKSGTSHAAFLVDTVMGAREIVVKNIGPQLARISGIAGATVQGDGRIMLILNPVPLALRALQQGITSFHPADEVAAPVVETVNLAPLVMVVDDSLTVRKITGRLLTREGYRMETAKDGVDALEKMHDLTPDLVLLDVEMPRMDGFELARVMRGDDKLKDVPIIMITSRTADKHRNHAMEIGVNIYMGKPYQEATLLENITTLLGEKALQPI